MQLSPNDEFCFISPDQFFLGSSILNVLWHWYERKEMPHFFVILNSDLVVIT